MVASSGDLDGAENASVEHRLQVALAAVADAERRAGDVAGELKAATEQLAAELASQEEWAGLLATQAEELRQSRERLTAIETSTTWRVAQSALAPYRLARRRLGR